MCSNRRGSFVIAPRRSKPDSHSLSSAPPRCLSSSIDPLLRVLAAEALGNIQGALEADARAQLERALGEKDLPYSGDVAFIDAVRERASRALMRFDADDVDLRGPVRSDSH